ncbi:cupin domain-containing protein [Aurantimicrobium minutum]|uniref:cupin domain-containing protein n=1 Tax=Aurantimicrobium minutum TaxID=708131 RepID=UPI0024755304|nr:cupin domain-containing protein [Aurantimicrobium minutum]MDH6423193.1 mannose-6-phosphate isomerase-like protein (cupin superfamily) [Aurantimicrobium minutum]
MSGYEVNNIGAPDTWREFYGGFVPQTSRQGRRVVDHEMTNQFIGMTANAYEPGEQAGYWHTHSEIEELYVFLEGTGQMGLDDDIVDVGPGSVVRVGQGVWRTWRAMPDSDGELRWLCIRAGAGELTGYPHDATRDEERAAPWK